MSKLVKYLFHHDHWLITIFAFVIVGLLYACVSGVSLFSPVKRAMDNMSTTDVFFKIANKNAPVNQDITVVDIKEEYDRAKIAHCIATIDSLKPWATGIDILFQGIVGEPEASLYLYQIAANMKSPTVWVTNLLDYDNEAKAFTGQRSSFFVDSLDVLLGFANLDDNLEHSTIRKMLTIENLGEEEFNSFPVAIAKALGDSVSLEPQSKLSIDYRTKFNIVPYDSVEQFKELVTDHVVVVGSTTTESDMWHTPLGKTPGVIVQAYSLNTIRNHSDIKYCSTWLNLLITFILCYLFELLIDMGFQWLRKRNNAFSTFMIDSKLMLRLATIVWMAIVTWVILLVFIYNSKYIDAILILVALGMLVESRRIYNAAIKALSKKHNWWILKNSLLNNPLFK